MFITNFTSIHLWRGVCMFSYITKSSYDQLLRLIKFVREIQNLESRFVIVQQEVMVTGFEVAGQTLLADRRWWSRDL